MNSKTATLFAKLSRFMEALGDRYQRVLQVIDEALASDNLKDKIWAVDLILKRTPGSDAPAGKTPRKGKLPDADLDKLSDAELMSRIRQQLDDLEL